MLWLFFARDSLTLHAWYAPELVHITHYWPEPEVWMTSQSFVNTRSLMLLPRVGIWTVWYRKASSINSINFPPLLSLVKVNQLTKGLFKSSQITGFLSLIMDLLSAPAEHDCYVPEPIVHDKFRVGRITGSIGKNRLHSQTLIFGGIKFFFYYFLVNKMK